MIELAKIEKAAAAFEAQPACEYPRFACFGDKLIKIISPNDAPLISRDNGETWEELTIRDTGE